MSLFLQPVLQDLLPFLSYVRVNWIQLITKIIADLYFHCVALEEPACCSRGERLIKTFCQIWLNRTMRTFPFIPWTSRGREHTTANSESQPQSVFVLIENKSSSLTLQIAELHNQGIQLPPLSLTQTLSDIFLKVCISCLRWMLFSLILLFIRMN